MDDKNKSSGIPNWMFGLLIIMIIGGPIYAMINNHKGENDLPIIQHEEVLKVSKVYSERNGKTSVTVILAGEKKIKANLASSFAQPEGFIKYMVKTSKDKKHRKSFVCNMIKQCYQTHSVEKYHPPQ